MRALAKWSFSVKIKGDQSKLCLNLGVKSRKNTHKVAKSFSGAEEGSENSLTKVAKDWTKPKSNALAAAANFRPLEQVNLSLAEYIDKATVLCDQCDRLLRDAIVIGLRSRETYFKCIEKSAALTLEEAIAIAQNEDATAI